MKFKILSLLLILLFINACNKEMRQAFGEMFELSAKLGDKFGEDSPNVSIGEKGIGITFVNSSFNNLSREEKKVKAQEMAEFVTQNYSNINRIKEITISFGIYKNYFGFEYKNNLDFYQFKVENSKVFLQQN